MRSGSSFPASNGVRATSRRTRSTNTAASSIEVSGSSADFARRLAQDVRELQQHAVPGLVSVCIVHGLEAVQVEHGHRDEVPRTLGALELVLEQVVDVAMVEEAGKAVADAQPFQLAVLLFQLVLQPLDPQHGADARLQLREVDGFGEVIVGTCVQPRHLVLRGIPRGDQDDRDEGQRSVVLDPARDLITVDVGEHHIEQDQVGRISAHPVERLRAIAGLDHVVAAKPQSRCNDLDVVGVVVDDQDLAAHAVVVVVDSIRAHRGRSGEKRRFCRTATCTSSASSKERAGSLPAEPSMC
jgi:hypothetical protein